MTRVLASIVALLLVLTLELPNTLASSAADDWPQHPTWEPTYDMAKSSIMMVRVRPCAYFGRFQLPPFCSLSLCEAGGGESFHGNQFEIAMAVVKTNSAAA
jgi:hypothetical protein